MLVIYADTPEELRNDILTLLDSEANRYTRDLNNATLQRDRAFAMGMRNAIIHVRNYIAPDRCSIVPKKVAENEV